MVWQVVPFLAVGIVLALALGPALNAIALGDQLASALGAKVGRVRVAGILATTLLCGAATAVAGPIAFIGLVVPHMVRAFTGPDNRWILPFSMVAGAVLVVGSDVVGRVVLWPSSWRSRWSPPSSAPPSSSPSSADAGWRSCEPRLGRCPPGRGRALAVRPRSLVPRRRLGPAADRGACSCCSSPPATSR